MHAEDVGLTTAEYDRIVKLMGREPNDVELGLFGALWSEHCSYKNSKGLLKRLPNRGPHVVQGPGANAGVVALDDQYELAFKVESHNHPSYVEPVQGAATGVGGILRDIIAMGARPMAVADMLRFGRDGHSVKLLEGVVSGVGQYGNAIGIPTVTGDVAFADGYAKNPLVNVLALGIRRREHAIGAASARPGQLLVLLGQRTGRDGIHGASLLASRDFEAGSEDLRPTVQVGDPFLGKLLMEVTLAAVHGGLLGALQDLGAAGLTSAVAELCYSSEVGAELELDRVPLREPGLSSYDIMLSETQERMLLAVEESRLSDLTQLADQHELLCSVIGRVVPGSELTIRHHAEVVAHLDAQWLVGEAPQRPVDDALWMSFGAPVQEPEVPAAAPKLSVALLLKVLGNSDVRDRKPIYRQYDSMIQTNTVRGPEGETAVLRVRGSRAGIALAVSGPARWAAVDAYAGGQGAVLAALARLAAVGAEPLGMTDGINAGNPDKADSYGAMAALIRGIADAAEAAQVPVTGGNVSLHNETDGRAIWPTVMIGAVGRLVNPEHPLAETWTQSGQHLYLINPSPLDWGGSAAQIMQDGEPGAMLRPDLAGAVRAMTAVAHWARQDQAMALRAVAAGGLGATLVRMMASGNPAVGADIRLGETRPEEKTLRLFNESPVQWVAVVEPHHREALESHFGERGVPVLPLGTVTDEALLQIDERYRWARIDLLQAWRHPYEEEPS